MAHSETVNRGGFLSTITDKTCVACNHRGFVVQHTLYDVDDNGKLARVLLARTISDRAVSTIQYSSCTNRRCMMHAELRTRRKEDADTLFRQLQDCRHRNRWKDNRPARGGKRKKGRGRKKRRPMGG